MFSNFTNAFGYFRPLISSLSSPLCKVRVNPGLLFPVSLKLFSTSHSLSKGAWFKEPTKFLEYNDIVYPPQKEGEPPRPAEVCHVRHNIKYSKKKFWYLALMLRGKSVDEALKQLEFYEREKGAKIITEVIKEAQDLAVKDHNVEYRSNLWIEHLYVTKAHTIKGLRRHGRGRYGTVHYRYSHLFIRLREGKPPKEYYKEYQTGQEKLEEYLDSLRKRTVHRSL